MTHTIKVNQILSSTWGSDQTNANFYQVTKVTKTMVYLQELAVDSFSDGDQTMTSTAVPNMNKPIGDVFRRLVNDIGLGEFVMINSYQSAKVWSGEPIQTSQYA